MSEGRVCGYQNQKKSLRSDFCKNNYLCILNALPLSQTLKDMNPTADFNLLKRCRAQFSPHEHKVTLIAWTETKQFLNAFHLSQPGPVQPLRCSASRFRRSRGLPNISPSQAWVDMTAAEDTFLIRVRRKCFLRRTSIVCQAIFFSSIFSMYKSSCYGFNRLSSTH